MAITQWQHRFGGDGKMTLAADAGMQEEIRGLDHGNGVWQ